MRGTWLGNESIPGEAGACTGCHENSQMGATSMNMKQKCTSHVPFAGCAELVRAWKEGTTKLEFSFTGTTLHRAVRFVERRWLRSEADRTGNIR